MATVTPIYNWPVPTSTDYVKDGATSIEALGDAIDSSLNSITSGKNVGLVHIGTTSFASQSTVNINNVFSSSFQDYRVVITASLSGTVSGQIQLRSGSSTKATDYNSAALKIVANNTTSGFGSGTATTWYFGDGLNKIFSVYDISQPFAAAATYATFLSSGNATTATSVYGGGFQTQGLSFDGFALSVGAQNMTGSVAVYGYRTS